MLAMPLLLLFALLLLKPTVIRIIVFESLYSMLYTVYTICLHCDTYNWSFNGSILEYEQSKTELVDTELEKLISDQPSSKNCLIFNISLDI